jgi:hypothetical protein
MTNDLQSLQAALDKLDRIRPDPRHSSQVGFGRLRTRTGSAVRQCRADDLEIPPGIEAIVNLPMSVHHA